MTQPAQPLALDQPDRLTVLEETALLDSLPEESFDRLSRLASRLLNAPVALVSLVDQERQFFKSCVGLPEPWASRREVPLSHSFCQHVVNAGEPLIIEDAREHPLVRENLAIHDLDVIAYAGIPLITSAGHTLGSFCAIDSVPRRWTEDEIAMLQDLAASVVTEIEMRTLVVERQKTEFSLRESEARYRVLAELSPDATHVVVGGKFVYANAAAARLLGAKDAQELIGRSPLEIATPEYHEIVRERIRRVLEEAAPQPLMESRWRRLDGSIVDVEVASGPIPWNGARAVQVVTRDISERKRSERRLLESVQEKEVLLREIHHRVKNNLQIISSLLSLQVRVVKDGEAAGMLRDSQVRIQSMAMVHETLYRSSNLASVDFGEYVRVLAAQLFRTYAADRDSVELQVETDAVQLDIDRAVPLGLIFAELFSNALKHAFPENKGGTIHVAFRHASPDMLILAVADTGGGLNTRTAGSGDGASLGLRLVEMLLHQIGGNLETQSTGGTEFRVLLPAEGK